jgi:hypothetical protein
LVLCCSSCLYVGMDCLYIFIFFSIYET